MVRAQAAIFLALVPLAVQLPSKGVNAAAIFPVSPRDTAMQDLTVSDASAPDVASPGVSPLEDATVDPDSSEIGLDLVDTGAGDPKPDESLGICNTSADCAHGQDCRNGLCVVPTGEPCHVHREGCKEDLDCCTGTCRWSWRGFSRVCK